MSDAKTDLIRYKTRTGPRQNRHLLFCGSEKFKTFELVSSPSARQRVNPASRVVFFVWANSPDGYVLNQFSTHISDALSSQ